MLRHAGRLAGEPAVIDGASGRVLTYGELAGGVERVAAGLAARGFGRGDVLALHLPNIPEFPVVLHGGLRAGGAVVAGQPALDERRARHPAAAHARPHRDHRRARSPRWPVRPPRRPASTT